jgi:hypothetical protein
MILGAALVKTQRDLVLNALPPGAMPKEFEFLLQAMREKKLSVLQDYLKVRGVVIERGNDAIQALIDVVVDDCKRQKVKAICSQLRFAVGGEDIPALKDRLREALQELEGIG